MNKTNLCFISFVLGFTFIFSCSITKKKPENEFETAMILAVESLENDKREKELNIKKKNAEKERIKKEKEKFAKKEAKLHRNISEYKEIAKSEFGLEKKRQAWSSLLKKMGLVKESIELEDYKGLRNAFFNIPKYLNDSRDNKNYKVLEINGQIWMAENLAYKANSCCWAYDNNVKNVEKYGYLYNFETAKNVCPAEWRLPNKSDFEVLLGNFGGSIDSTANYKALIHNGESGFSTSFGGWRFSNGYCVGIDESAYFWSLSKDGNYTWSLELHNFLQKAYMKTYAPGVGMSVRCIRNSQ